MGKGSMVVHDDMGTITGVRTEGIFSSLVFG